jgi:hypothetical protein
MLDNLDFSAIRDHYNTREETHVRLLQLFTDRNINDYLQLALGVSDATGNYSAAEYNLGPLILSNNTTNSIFGLAQDLFSCEKITHVPNIIHARNLNYLKISVGSEIGTMLRPDEIWIGNRRTIWSHLIIKHNWNSRIANEELELYRDDDRNAEMNYRVWRDIYLSLDASLEELLLNANEEARIQNIQPGRRKYLWADAIASELYDQRDNI